MARRSINIDQHRSRAIDVLNSYSQAALPRTVEELFDWGEWMWTRCGEYSQAINKIISYFLVDIEVTGLKDYESKKKYKDYLKDDMDVLKIAYEIGKDVFAYGNCFLSFHVPFSRILTCSRCGSSFPVDAQPWTFKYQTKTFRGKCLSCKRDVDFKRTDAPLAEATLRLLRWDPRDIHIEYNAVTDTREYYYTPPAGVQTDIKAGKEIYMKDTPWTVVESVIDGRRIKFDEGKIKHIRYDGIASLKSKLKGWGIPPFYAAFDQVMMVCLLKRYTEAVLTDYLIPFRFLSPAKSGSAESDPLLDIDAGNFMRSVEEMISAQRSNPSLIHSIPYPVNYQAIGGEAKNLAPVELHKYYLETMFNTLGVAQEFYVSNLNTQGPPIGLRIFERQHCSFFHELDSFLVWVGDELTRRKMWEGAKIKFTRTSVFEDDQTKEVKLGMLSSNKVSNHTALHPFGIDYEEEIDRILDEQQMFDKKVLEVQRSQAKAGELQGAMDQPVQQPGMEGMPPEGGAPAGGGAAPMPAPGGSASIEELHMQAEQTAQELMTMDQSTRRSQLIELGKQNEELHALVKEKLRKLEQSAAQQGLNMTRAGQIPPPGAQQA